VEVSFFLFLPFPILLIADCGSEVVLRPGDIVICRECGYRILFKKRTKQGRWTFVCNQWVPL